MTPAGFRKIALSLKGATEGAHRGHADFRAGGIEGDVAERFIRTLKEQLLWVQSFDTVEELRMALLAFKERYNREWLCERHGHQTPAAVRARSARRLAAA